MKINHSNACFLTALCLSLPTALLAADQTANTVGTGQKERVSQTDQTPLNNGTAGDMNNGMSDKNYGNQGKTYNGKNTTDRMTSRMGTTITPMACNKASSLIGMEVRNQANEKLGDIKDVVIDFQSGKVSYAVLDAGTLFQSKLFAVPLSAFSPSENKNYLTLNADKSKIETAQGFDKNSWPSVSNPDWGASTFWDQNATSHENYRDMDKNNMKSGQSDKWDKNRTTDTQMP